MANNGESDAVVYPQKTMHAPESTKIFLFAGTSYPFIVLQER
jgi:hypothetical protein